MYIGRYGVQFLSTWQQLTFLDKISGIVSSMLYVISTLVAEVVSCRLKRWTLLSKLLNDVLYIGAE